MKALLRNALKKECDKHIQRYFEYLEELHDYEERRSRREGQPYKKTIHAPPWWKLSPKFNPFKVRTAKNLRRYSYTIAKKLRAQAYRPEPAVIQYVPKEDGSRRTLNIFPLPDSALSNLTFRSLLEKNSAKLSSYAYAYRDDRTSHDAVHQIISEWRQLDRVYVAEYDFSKFFDYIDHEHLWNVLRHNSFVISDRDRQVIEAFLKSSASERKQYPRDPVSRKRGIPQGTSISLFLANVACWELDRELERLGVGFARYADDTLIWSEDYSKIVRAYYKIDEYATRMGVPLSPTKSHGISLLNRIGKQAEISSKTTIDYLGYRISLSDIAISEQNVRKIKGRISFLVYQNLIQPLRRGTFNRHRVTGPIDLDYMTAVRQVQAFLYGGLTEDKLRQFISGRIASLNFRGVMSYYPVVTDITQLANLEGWIKYVFRQALRLRQRLWYAHDGTHLPGPFAGWIDNVGELRSVVLHGNPVDVTLPSLRLINRAMKIAIAKRGIGAVANPASRYYT